MSEKKTHILVKSKTERFRRAGIEFTRAGVELDPAELTAEQAEAINDEPNLVIVGGDIEAGETPAKVEGKKPAKKAR